VGQVQRDAERVRGPRTSSSASGRRCSARFFKSRWLPYVLVAPQMVVTVLFFFWPALKVAAALLLPGLSLRGTSPPFVGLENFTKLLADPDYYASVVKLVRVRGRGDRPRGAGLPGPRRPSPPRKIRGPRGLPHPCCCGPYGHRARGGGHHLPVSSSIPPTGSCPTSLGSLRDRLPVQTGC